MAHLVLFLVLISAFAHASWNLVVKRVGGGLLFQWLFTLVSIALYAPLALAQIASDRAHWSTLALLLTTGTALLHLAYFALLNRGYAVGDLSLTDPLARASGLLLATGVAVVVLSERPTPLALGGALLIGVGAAILSGKPRPLKRPRSERTIMYALLIGVMIAAYTLLDKAAVADVAVSPVTYYWGATTLEGLFLAPVVLRSTALRQAVRSRWRRSWRAAIAVGMLSPLAYLLVLTALVSAPVYYVAPVRETGILIGVVMGTQVLREQHTWSRLAAAIVMVSGVALLAVG
jgi:drug/metabolite transporter (DMT)-like permease